MSKQEICEKIPATDPEEGITLKRSLLCIGAIDNLTVISDD